MAQKQTPGALGCNEGLGGWVQKLKRRFCSHSFAIEDLEMVNRDSDGADRVAWPCSKCSKVFRAHCGLDISPTHGPTFRREPLNAELSGAARSADSA
jgi:hypothetical protein